MNFSPPWETVQIRRKKLFAWGIAALVSVFVFTPLLAPVRFLCLFFFFILIASRFYSEYLVRNIRVIRNDTELRVFRHEWVRVEIKIENRGLLPAFMLAAGDLPGNIQVFIMRKTFCTLWRRSWTVLCWEGYCVDRGVFNIGPAVIRGADPLGLFPFHLTAKEITKLFVYPVFRSVSIKASGGIPLGNIISANPLFDDITRNRSLRPYNPGDEPRRINWKASAHVSGVTQTGSGSLLVNEYEATASYPLMIFLNLDRNEYPVKKQNAYIERAIEAAAALCLRASSERQELGIIFYTSCREEGVCAIAPSTFTLVPILERLAAVDWTKTAAENTTAETLFAHNSAMVMLNQGKRLPYGTRYMYTGPDLGDEAYISLNSLKKYHLYPEYLIINERAMPSLVPGNSPRYQMKESGYEIV